MQATPTLTPPDDLRTPPGKTEKPPRNRVIQACLPCHHSKRKCNRKKPCSQCLKRHASGGCVYESVAPENLDELQQEGASPEAENQALRSRIADLEAAIADYKLQRRATTASHKRSRAQFEAASEGGGGDKGVYYGDSYYLGSSAAPDLLLRMSKLVPQDNTDLYGAFAGSSVGAANLAYYAFPTLFNATQGIKELTDILHSLGRQHCDTLLDAFFDVVDPLHHYIPRAWLMSRYERCWAANRDDCPAQEVALVFAVLALGDLVTHPTYAVLMISASMQLLRISNFLANPSLECIATFCFIAVYLQHEGKLGEFWPLLGLVLRLAQSMALHRDPSAVMKIPDAEAELRRRLFWSLAAHETSVSSMSGRPHGLPFTDCKLPRDMSDEELFGRGAQKIAWEGSGLNEVSYNRLVWQLGAITREILRNASHDASDDMLAERQGYERRIDKWLEALPPHFQYDKPGELPTNPTSGQARIRVVQSIVLHIVAKFNILVLYRKPLLAGRPCDDTRKACCEAAFEVADGWRVLQDSFPGMARMAWAHWFLAFHAALICLVVIRTDHPRSTMGPRALDCWVHFLRIFTRIQDQNQSINNCWRALVRLDAAVQREEKGPNGATGGYTKTTRDAALVKHESSLSKLLIPTNDLRPNAASLLNQKDLDSGASSSSASLSHREPMTTTCYPTDSSTTPPATASHMNTHSPFPTHNSQSLDALLGVNMLFGTAPELPTPGFEMQGFDIFDMDSQHWPPWLTASNSPDYQHRAGQAAIRTGQTASEI